MIYGKRRIDVGLSFVTLVSPLLASVMELENGTLFCKVREHRKLIVHYHIQIP